MTPLLRSNGQGDRIVGLALVQANPSALNIDDLLRIFSSSASAFEQYHSLLALDAIAPILGTGDRAMAVSVLEREKADPRGLGVSATPTYRPGSFAFVKNSVIRPAVDGVGPARLHRSGTMLHPVRFAPRQPARGSAPPCPRAGRRRRVPTR